MIWYNIIYAKKQFARWQRPDQSKWSNGFSVDTGSVCPCEPHHLPKSSTMNRNQQQIHIKSFLHLNPFTITTQHRYRASTIMLSPFTVMFTGIWCGIKRRHALINPPGHCKEFGHEKWAVCCWATRPPDNWYHLEGSGTHEMILCLLLLMLLLMLLLPLILFLLWFFFFGIVPQQLRVGCLPKVVSCCYINPSMTQVSLDETICHLPPSSEPSCTCSQQHMLQIAKYQQQRTIAAQRSWNHNPEGIFCSFTPLIRSQPSFLFQGVLVPSFQ